MERELPTPNGAIKTKQTTRFLAPRHLRQDQELPFGKVIIYSDGKGGWLVGPQGEMPMQPQILKQVESALFRMFIPLMLSDRDAERSVNLAAPGTLEIADKAGQSVRIEIDENTNLPKKLSYVEAGQNVDELLGDWRDVSGLKLPHARTLAQGNQKSDGRVLEYRVNTGLTAEELARKP
jgi:hypothetical protein